MIIIGPVLRDGNENKMEIKLPTDETDIVCACVSVTSRNTKLVIEAVAALLPSKSASSPRTRGTLSLTD
jgi:uncharacterized protein YsxB (DUF464 family)